MLDKLLSLTQDDASGSGLKLSRLLAVYFESLEFKTLKHIYFA